MRCNSNCGKYLIDKEVFRITNNKVQSHHSSVVKQQVTSLFLHHGLLYKTILIHVVSLSCGFNFKPFRVINKLKCDQRTENERLISWSKLLSCVVVQINEIINKRAKCFF